MDDIPAIMQFVEKNWKENHILARDEEFFHWMYTDEEGCNVVLAEDEHNDICGMIGVIKYNSTKNPDIVGTMWKVLHTKNPQLGLDIGKKMYEIYNPRCDIGPGLNKRALKINQMLGYFGAAMGHLYVLGACTEYRIAKVIKKQERISCMSKKRLFEIHTKDKLRMIYNDALQRRRVPYKDFNYVVHRFMQHPIYTYRFLGIQNEEGVIKAFFVVREVEHDGAKACKIVDYYGPYEEIIDTASEVYRFVDENNYEYMDIYCYGVPEEYLFTAGFSWCTNEEAIIPNYFAPFEQKNTDIYFATTLWGEFDVFRGDADQDRPS